MVIVLFLIAFYSNSIAQKSDTLQIPFIERFTEGSLEINNWTTDCDNWEMNTDIGKPPPSIRFSGSPEIIGIYNCILTSDWISSTIAADYSKVFLKFNYKMHANDSSMVERMYIEIFNSDEWETIDIIYQSSSGWKIYQEKIKSFITNTHFKIRFRVYGLSSSAGEYWDIDNIFIYNGAISPYDLVGDYLWENDNFGVELQWFDEQPMAGHQPQTHCISWFDNIAHVGTQDGGDWSWTAKFDTLLFPSDSLPLTMLSTHINGTDFDSLVFNIWRGAKGDILEYSRNVTSQVTTNLVTKLYFVPPLMIYDTSEIWAGFTVYGQETGAHPAGLEIEDPVIGYGNLVKFNGQETWDTLSNYGLGGNWSLFLFYNYGLYHEHNGYNIYRKEGENQTYAFLKHIDYQVTYYNSYFDKYPSVNIQTPYWYKVTNVYTDHSVVPAVTYESIPGYAPNSDDDFVMVFVTSIPESENDLSNVSAYPNPTTTTLNLKSEGKLKTVFIFNLIGQMVREVAVNNENQTKIDVSDLKNGVYLIKIETAVGVFTKKIVIE